MINTNAQVIDCFEVFDDFMLAYDTVVDLLTNDRNAVMLGTAEGRAEIALRRGGEDTIWLTLFDSGVEFSIEFVCKDMGGYKAGQVVVFAYS